MLQDEMSRGVTRTELLDAYSENKRIAGKIITANSLKGLKGKLDGAIFSRCKFLHHLFVKWDFEGSYFAGCDFKGCNFDRVMFSGSAGRV